MRHALAIGLICLLAPLAGRGEIHPSLRHPFVMLYYVEPTLTVGDTAKISYYVTDYDHAKVRFGDESHRFDVVLAWTADRKSWRKLVQKGVKSGDGTFEIPNVECGDYLFKVLCRDEKGVMSRTVWNEFRVRTADERTVKASETARPTLADLKAAGIAVERDDFYHIEPVDIGEIVPEKNAMELNRNNRDRANTEKVKALRGSIREKVKAAIESAAGQKLVKAHPDGYVVFAPAKDGNFIFRTRDYRKIVPGERFDAAAVEATAAANSRALTKYLKDLAAAGKRKVVLPKTTIRLSANEIALIPGDFTLDLGGGKLKMNASNALQSQPIQMFRVKDAHLVNGTVEGQYFEYGYETCGEWNPEHVGLLELLGDSRFCSFEDLDIRYTVSRGTTFCRTWLEDPYAKPKWDVREWLERNPRSSFAAYRPKPKKGKPQEQGDSWEPGRIGADGVVRDGGEGCYTSPFRALGGFTNKTFLAVSRFLGYGGLSGASPYFTIGFYDKEKKPLSSEVAFQYHRVGIPLGAKYARISLVVGSLEKANASDLNMFLTYTPSDCTYRRIRYTYGRTQGLSIVDGFNMLFEDIEIAHCGDESCQCASDAEDGWDAMQNMTHRRICCHDNPNGDFHACCGHAFVYEDCKMGFRLDQRVHSALIRNCTVTGGYFPCLTFSRGGYTRFENNTFTGGICLGMPKNILNSKASTGIKPDWEIVIDNGVFKGKDKDHPLSFSAGATGRYRACTFENCILGGAKEAFTDCKLVNSKFAK